MMRITAIIPTYNRADAIVGSMQSVLEQTLPCSELIVVDDGSTDKTAEVVEEFRPQCPIPMTFLRQENQGKSGALNNALKHVTGDWIAFNDDDDHWHRDKLARQKEVLDRYPECGVCFTDARYTNDPEHEITSFQHAAKKYGAATGKVENSVMLAISPPHGIYMQSMLMRTEAMRAVGEFDRKLRVTQDTDFIFRLALRAEFCFINEPLVDIDRTPTRKVGAIEKLRKEEFRLQTREYMYRKWMEIAEQEDLGGEVRDVIRTRLRDVHSGWANHWLGRNEFGKALDEMISAANYQADAKTILKLILVSVAPSVAQRRESSQKQVQL